MLGVILIAAVVAGGTPRFTGPRWLPSFVRPPAPSQPAQSPPSQTPLPLPQQSQGNRTLLSIIGLVVVVAIALFVFFLVMRILRARLQRGVLPAFEGASEEPLITSAEVHDEPEPDAPVVRRGLLLALDALDDDREPADAVVRAWLGLQEAADISGVQRRAAETPTEFTSRVIARVHADEAAARQLVDVYQGVRFGGHPITAADVQTAREAIGRLLESWHEPAAGRSR